MWFGSSHTASLIEPLEVMEAHKIYLPKSWYIFNVSQKDGKEARNLIIRSLFSLNLPVSAIAKVSKGNDY